MTMQPTPTRTTQKEDEMESAQPTERIAPVRKRVVVDAPVEHAFRVFTERIAEWWPVKTHSVHKEAAQTAGLEPRLGGAVYELWPGGREEWGTITVWEPPRRLVYTWHPSHGHDESTEVEVRFSAEDGSTLVELEHRGWEARGAKAAEIRNAYDSGWEAVLARFVEAASG
jgi:uncharacterized protein YndB with AHSA1/START domain